MNGFKQAIYGIVALGALSGAQAIDASKGNYHTLSLSGAATLTVSNVKPGQTLYVQVTQAGAYAITWAGQVSMAATTPGGGATTIYEFIGTSEAQGAGSALLIDLAISSATAASDEVIVYPTGTDDTTNINAVCAAGLYALLGPSGSIFFINGSTNPVLTASNSGGIIGMGEGVEIRPTADWVPAIGLIDDSTNAFFRVEGQDRSGGYTGSIAATIQVRGGNVLTGIGSTTGILSGTILEVKASPTGGSILPVQRCMIRSAGALSGTAISLASPLRLAFGDVYNTLPAILTEITPITRFRIQNVLFNTLGRNIAVGVNFVRCFDASTTSFSVTSTATPALLAERVRGKGFTKAMFAEACCDGIVYRDNYSGGLNNCVWYAETSHGWRHNNWRSIPTGPAYNTVGQTRPAFWSWAGGSDGVIQNCHIENMCGFAHVVGGFANKFDNNTMYGAQADIRFTRDSMANTYIGAMYCQSLQVGTNTDISVEYDWGTAVCKETYTNSTTYPVNGTNGVWAFVAVDTYGLSWNTLNISNVGNGADTLNGTMYAPGGGVFLFDGFYGGTGSQINARNVSGAALCLRQAGWGGQVNQIRLNKRAGKTTGTVASSFPLLFACTGSRTVPRIDRIELPDGGLIASFDAIWTGGTPDYNFRLGEVVDDGGSVYFRDVVFAINTAAAVFLVTDVAAMDVTSAAGTRKVVVAVADAAGPCIIAQTTNTTQCLVALGGGSVNTTGAVVPGDLLTTEGGVNHRAKVNNAATPATMIGRSLLAQAATGVINTRAF